MLPILHSTCKRISHAEVFFKEAPLKNVAHGRVPFQLESFRLKVRSFRRKYSITNDVF